MIVFLTCSIDIDLHKFVSVVKRSDFFFEESCLLLNVACFFSNNVKAFVSV